jgi:ABC-2 type transport system ATP-binding protein
LPETAIRLDNLTRHFRTVRAVNNLSLDVPAGTILGFLGPNGAGKTTTIHLLLGLLEPTRGSARVLGFDSRTQGGEIRERTGALLEHTGLYEHLTAEENLEFYGRIWRLSPTERRKRAEELLTNMGLWDRRADRVGSWSRGMKQKLALARAILHNPPLVFLDEPTAGLDVLAAQAVRDELAALAGSGITIFLTTHNMTEAERLCGQVAVIRNGTLIALGHPDELRGSSAARVEVVGSGFDQQLLGILRARPDVTAAEMLNDRLSIETSADADVAPLVDLMVNAGVRVEEIRRGKASLEEVFLTLMEEGEDSE